jgi:PAS domain S-box-containing protein
MVGRDITASIDESILLLDQDLKLLLINEKMERIIGKKTEEVKGDRAAVLFEQDTGIESEIMRMMSTGRHELSCRLNIGQAQGRGVLMDARFSIIRDKWDDILGVLCIAKEVKSVELLKTTYGITDREAGVIGAILDGLSNSKIAQGMHISENTVKVHIGRIYEKLGVKNRIQLVNQLIDFELQINTLA